MSVKRPYHYFVFLFCAIILWSCGARDMAENKSRAEDSATDSTCLSGNDKVSYMEQEKAGDSLSLQNETENKFLMDTNSIKESALQKLKDFCSYLEIISNKRYDKSLREEALKQSLVLFNSPDSNLLMFPTGQMACNIAKQTLKDYLNEILYGDEDSINVMPDAEAGCMITKPGAIVNGEQKGLINCSIDFRGFKHGKLIYECDPFEKIEFILRTKEKAFGDRRNGVLKIFLGNSLAAALPVP